MSTLPTLLEQFRSFNLENNYDSLDTAIEYFCVFGGMGWDIDTSRPLDEIIQSKLLDNYRYIHGDITKITQSNKLYHALLTALATGDGREHSAFKKARVSRQEGEEAIDFLEDNELLWREKPQARPLDEEEEVSDKMHFTLPFMRFWFACISPYYKGIKEGDYEEFFKAWQHRKSEFSQAIYDKLVKELIKLGFQEDPVAKIGSYWDKHHQIDILAKTRSGKVIAGTCRFSQSKMKKSELNKLKQDCLEAELQADIFVLFSSKGFSSELKNIKGTDLKLFTQKNLNLLLENLGDSDRITYTNKRY